MCAYVCAVAATLRCAFEVMDQTAHWQHSTGLANVFVSPLCPQHRSVAVPSPFASESRATGMTVTLSLDIAIAPPDMTHLWYVLSGSEFRFIITKYETHTKTRVW